MCNTDETTVFFDEYFVHLHSGLCWASSRGRSHSNLAHGGGLLRTDEIRDVRGVMSSGDINELTDRFKKPINDSFIKVRSDKVNFVRDASALTVLLCTVNLILSGGVAQATNSGRNRRLMTGCTYICLSRKLRSTKRCAGQHSNHK